MKHPVSIADQSVGQAAKIQQPIPISIIACESRHLESENDTDFAERDLGSQPNKASAFGDTSAGKAEVFINQDHLLLGPTKLIGSFGQRVLTCGRLAMLLHLRGSGLAHINDGCSLDMSWFDLGRVGHLFVPL